MLVHGAEKPQTLGGHCYPRNNEHHTTPFDGRKMRKGNDNIVGLHGARGCRGAVQASKGMYEAFADTVLVSAVKCGKITTILLVYAPREGGGALYKHSTVFVERLPTQYW